MLLIDVFSYAGERRWDRLLNHSNFGGVPHKMCHFLLTSLVIYTSYLLKAIKSARMIDKILLCFL